MAQENAGTSESETPESERRPYIVVLMSAEMKTALQEFAKSHDTNPTALARTLLAQHIGYDLTSEPQPTSRKKYETPAEREAAHKLASKKSGLLRKALFQSHTAQIKSKKELLASANRIVLDLGDPAIEHTMETLEALDKALNAAIKAGK